MKTQTQHTPGPVGLKEIRASIDPVMRARILAEHQGCEWAIGTTDEVLNTRDIYYNEWQKQKAINAELLAALEEIRDICTESQAECRKRMGTRVGNCLAVCVAAIAKAKGQKAG